MHRHASVNRIYRLVWSHASNSWVPAAETTRGRGKGSCKTLLAAAMSLVAAGLAEAAPHGGQVVSGSGHIGQSGALTTITQTSSVLSLSWASFNIAPQETVDFVQPSASAIAVNRISGGNGTEILGHLDANGQVYLINPNGIVFGRGAQVDVGGLVASTLNLSDASPSGDARTFGASGSVSGTGRIVNDGAITATGDGSGGGYVALLGNHVVNQGTISAQLGTVALGAGSAATLTFRGDSLVHLQVSRSVLNSVAANGGLIRADGGQVLLSAGAADALLASVVNNTGKIEARTVEDHAGSITLLGGMAAGTVNVAGTLDASAPAGGNGGFIETSAAHVEVANSAKVTTAAAHGLYGSWLIDPQDFTVAASGGDITGATLSGELATTNEILQSSAGATAGSGNVNINDPVFWSANTTLTLIASNDVNINSSITAAGNTAGLVISPNTRNGDENPSGTGTYTLGNGAAINLPGTNPSLSIAGASYIVINALGGAGDAATAPAISSLQGMAASANLGNNYALGSNIDATATSGWNAGLGFTPIGSSAAAFNGLFDGLGHTIGALVIDQVQGRNLGLFGVAGSSSTIENVGLIGGSVLGISDVGGLVGQDAGSINSSYTTGAVTGRLTSNTFFAGGLVGRSQGPISNSYATGTVTGYGKVGGLVGGSYGPISNSYATGTVTSQGSLGVGGLVGQNQSTIANSYATGAVNGPDSVGGLVGNNSGSISNSYATGSVNSGGYNSGGLVGLNNGTISNTYATGSVSGYGGGVGGLVGLNNSTISNSYATGSVSGYGGGVGGLVGLNNGTISESYAAGGVNNGGYATLGGLVGVNVGGVITDSYWNTETSGQTTSAQTDGSHSGLGGLTTLQMQNSAYFVGFDFSTVAGASGNSWVMVDEDGGFNNAQGYVAGQHYNSVPGATFPMLTSEYSTVIANPHQLQLMVLAPGASYTLAANIDASATALGGASGGDVWSTAGGFFPVGTGGNGAFTGTFDGLGHTISNLTMAWPANLAYIGLFGNAAPGSIIGNVGLIGASVTAIGVSPFTQPGNGTGALVGTNQGSISNSYATGVVSGSSYVGGLVGNNYGIGGGFISNSHATVTVSGTFKVGGLAGANYGGGSITNSYASGTVVGSSTAGGLVGWNNASIANSYATGNVSDGMGSGIVGGLVGNNYGSIANSYATGAVTGTINVGGLAGANSGSIANAYATGAVTGSNYVGGLVGVNMSSIANAYATGNVSGGGNVGGLVGYNHSGISNTYATGNVTGSVNVGGLVGTNLGGISDSYAGGSVGGDYNIGGLVGTNYGSVSTSYADGSVSGSFAFGGLVGNNYGSVDNSFWNSDVIGIGVGANGGGSGTVTGGGGLTGGEMDTMSNFAGAGWSISDSGGGDVWQIYEGNTAPLLSSFLTPLTVTASNASNVFDGVGFTGNGVTYSATPNGNLLGTLSYGTAQGAVDAGSYTITPTGLYSTQQGYSITVVSANLTIAPLALTGSISTGSSVYGSALMTGTVVFANLIPGYTAVSSATSTLSITGNLSTSNHLNVGSYTGSESVTGSLSGADAGDYSFTGAIGDYTVSPLALTGSIATGSSVYGSALTPGAVSFSNAIGGDAVSAGGNVSVSTTNHTSSSGHFIAGTHTGSESVGSALSGADAGDYTFAGATGDYTVTPLALTGSIATGGSVYGSALTPGAATLIGVIGNDALGTATVIVNTTGLNSTSGNLTAGSHSGIEAVSALSGADSANYSFASLTGNYTVTPLALTGAIATGSSIYGSALTPGALSLSGAIGGDIITAAAVAVNTAGNLSTSGHFTAGTHTGSESVIGSLSGADAGDYTFAGATGDYTVTPLALTGSIATGSSIYGSALTPGAVSLSGVISGDIITPASVAVNTVGNLSTSGHFTAGTHTGSESVTDSLSGADAGDYTFTGAIGDYTVSPLALTGSIATGSSVYGSALTPGAVSFSNAIGGDAVSAGGNVSVSTTNHTSSSGHFIAGTHTGSESVGSALSGADAGDYTFAGATGDYTVTPLALTGSIATGGSVYGSALTPGAATLIGVIGNDALGTATVIVNTTGLNSTSGNLTAGSHSGIEAVSALSGADSANYSFASLTGNYTVTPLALTGAIATGSSIYGSALTPGALSLSGAIGGDIITAAAVAVNTAGNLSTSGHFTAGTHTGSESVIGSLSGADAGDYTFAGATGDYTVTPLALTGSIATGSSIYGSGLTPGAVSLSGVISGDIITPASVAVNTVGNLSTSGHFTAGTHTGSESVIGSLSGADAGDYTFAGATGDYTVTPLALTGSIATGSSIYGSGLTPGAVSLSGVISGDIITPASVAVNTVGNLSTSGHFTAGTHTGSESVIDSLSGADAGDYTFTGAIGDYTVSPLALTGSIATGSSVYGSALTPGAVSFSNAIGGDAVSAGGNVSVSTTNHTSSSGNFTAGSHPGSESVGGTLTGADAGDYTFTGAIGDYTVAPLALSVTANGVNKVYDGTTTDAPTLTGGGMIPGDQVTLADAAANFAGKNVGTAQAVTVSGISIGGVDAVDYVLNSTTAMAAATISPASLTVTGVAASNKVYDGTTAAILAGGSLVGVIAGDAGLVALTEAGSFDSKNAGTGIAVAAADTLTGAGAGNYVLVEPTGLTASITPATLTYDATPAIRTAGQSPTGLSGSLSGFVASETVAGDTTGTLAWTTPATAASHAGQYAIDGGGLTAANYVFVEASGNAGALTLQAQAVPPGPTPPALPPAALSAIAGLQAALLVPPASAPPEAEPEILDEPVTLIAAQAADAGILGSSGSADVDRIGSTNDFQTSAQGDYPVADTQRTIGTTGASLRILSGGVRLPP